MHTYIHTHIYIYIYILYIYIYMYTYTQSFVKYVSSALQLPKFTYIRTYAYTHTQSFVKYVSSALQLLGFNEEEANQQAAAVLAVETAVARHRISRVLEYIYIYIYIYICVCVCVPASSRCLGFRNLQEKFHAIPSGLIHWLHTHVMRVCITRT